MDYYRPLMAMHIIAVISWMAGILYLYRLLVYAREQGTTNEGIYFLLKTMTRRLLNAITLPAMIFAWVFGITMLCFNPTLLAQPWVHVKLVMVIFLTIATLFARSLVRRYHANIKPLPTSKNLRILNEVPTLLMIIIVFMAILKPLF